MSSCIPWKSCVARAGLSALLLVLAFAGCGGGVDSGGTGAPASASSASGPITGFGSVIVSGVHFDDIRASIADAEGHARKRDALKLGMIATIRGSALVTDTIGTRSSANSIVLSNALLGPITNIDTNARTLTVLGQTVEVKSTSVFDVAGGLAALSTGDVIEVYALINASNNHYSATRIERKIGVSAYELRGVVSGLNTSAQTFNIGGQSIGYSGIPASEVPASLTNGRLVRVQLQPKGAPGVWTATKLQDGVLVLAEQDEARIEGLVTSVESPTQFSVDGVSVDASEASIQAGSVGIGLRVAVEGLVRGGIVVASRVHIKSDMDVENEGFELDGTISSLDAASKIFMLQGVSVDYSGNVDYRNGTNADLAIGKQVEVNGVLSGDETGVQALTIKFGH
jgi:hypothetical protein